MRYKNPWAGQRKGNLKCFMFLKLENPQTWKHRKSKKQLKSYNQILILVAMEAANLSQLIVDHPKITQKINRRLADQPSLKNNQQRRQHPKSNKLFLYPKIQVKNQKIKICPKNALINQANRSWPII